MAAPHCQQPGHPGAALHSRQRRHAGWPPAASLLAHAPAPASLARVGPLALPRQLAERQQQVPQPQLVIQAAQVAAVAGGAGTKQALAAACERQRAGPRTQWTRFRR